MTPNGRPSWEPEYEPAERFPHPWFEHIEDGRHRAHATLQLAFRKGPAHERALVEDVIAASTGNLADFERQVLASWLIQRLEAEGFRFEDAKRKMRGA